MVYSGIYSKYRTTYQTGWLSKELVSEEYIFKLDPTLLEQLAAQSLSINTVLNNEKIIILKEKIENCLEAGPGFCILKGLNIKDMTEVEIERSFAQLCRVFGSAISQTKSRNFMGRVEDVGRDLSDRTARGHQTAAALPFHADRCDRTALLCVRPAGQGGENSIVSSLKLAETCLTEDKPEGKRLFSSFAFDNRGEQNSGLPQYSRHPIFSQKGDIFTSRYIRRFIEAVPRLEGGPKLQEIDISALNYLDGLIDQKRFQHNFKCLPGDIFIMNNLVTLHSRKAFKPVKTAGKGRLLLRVWMSHHTSRRLPESYETLFKNIEPGVIRGGVWPQYSPYKVPEHLKEI